jgi:hypothetical protein
MILIIIRSFAASLAKKDQRPLVANPPITDSLAAVYHIADHKPVSDTPIPMVEELEDMVCLVHIFLFVSLCPLKILSFEYPQPNFKELNVKM